MILKREVSLLIYNRPTISKIFWFTENTFDDYWNQVKVFGPGTDWCRILTPDLYGIWSISRLLWNLTLIVSDCILNFECNWPDFLPTEFASCLMRSKPFAEFAQSRRTMVRPLRIKIRYFYNGKICLYPVFLTSITFLIQLIRKVPLFCSFI